jgi:hypothetical protein
MHVPLTITAHIVDVHIEDMGILLDLPAGNAHQAIPVLGIEEFTNLSSSRWR